MQYKNIIPIYKLSDNKKGTIVNDNINKMIKDDFSTSDEDHEINNVPNYNLFNKYVFDIYQQVERIEFAYTILVL